MKLLFSLNKALEIIFLQFYTKNLSRSYRSTPADACADSEIQMTTMIILLLGGLFLVAGSLLFPRYLQSFVNGGNSSIVVLVVLTAGVAYSVHLRFGRFERTPDRAQPYRSARSRLWTQTLFWSFGIGWLVIAIVTLAHKRL
jgi:hypothetical protein